MWQQGFIRWSGRGLLVLVSVLACAAVTPVMAVQAQHSSDLSRWLSHDALPQIRQLFSRHPRYRAQRVQIQAGNPNGLSAALVNVLNNNLGNTDGISLIAREHPALTGLSTPGSVDELTCNSSPAFDYLLRASAVRGESGPDQVQLTLLDVHADGEQVRSWQWQGRYSSAERKQQKKPVSGAADGSLGAPWGDQDVDAAAMALSRDFACALRPQIKNRLSLQWPQELKLSAVFTDTANATRHRLGNFRELGISAGQAEYSVAVTVERFRDDIWQLWLTGSPRDAGLAPVQAVAYLQTREQDWQGATVPLVKNTTAPLLPPANPGPALEFIDVEMLDATQADKGRSRADLQVTLRIGNRAQWPIAYSFTLSGGHFENCVARPGYYRHDRYGLLSGRLEGGATEIRRLVIENARHNPAPLYGIPKCAGFRNLEGFEEFASQGYKVTDYVRWDM